MKYIMTLLMVLGFNFKANADVDPSDLALADESIDSPSLNIEGQYQIKEAPKKALAPIKIKKPLTASEKIRLYREQLEIRNQIMVQRKMEQIRLQQELALARKLEQSMNQTIQAIDNSTK
jgi:hypothetical protein